MQFLLGTNERVKTNAKQFIKKHGREQLKEVAKISFKTTIQIDQELQL
jgi:ribonuclease HIII